jgi:UDP-N-acetylglucosamine 2-epimerase (non-hydrolysing)
MLAVMHERQIVEVAGARPNFMKIAPIHRHLKRSDRLTPILVHAEQHYDQDMSDVFFRELGLDEPDIRLGVGSGTHAEQTARVLTALEPHLVAIRPVAVLVVGDVNTTLAGALCAAKLCLPVVHVEAGLRSHDRNMPEEINRVMTDSIADLLLAPSQDAVENLIHEGHPPERILMVGNVMIDSLDLTMAKIRESRIVTSLGLVPRSYLVATLHRPSNVDAADDLAAYVDMFLAASRIKPLVFVVHPRTMTQLRAGGHDARLAEQGIVLRTAMGYVDFLALIDSSAAVLTDSGGIQEETTVLGIPCLTLRDETERPVTVLEGTNRLVGRDTARVIEVLHELETKKERPSRPPLWDGHASQRIAEALTSRYGDGT